MGDSGTTDSTTKAGGGLIPFKITATFALDQLKATAERAIGFHSRLS
jgi:hypothetical protein